MKYGAFYIICLLSVLPVSVQAEQLFPPKNEQAESHSCPENQVLIWNGNALHCEGLTVSSCPEGQGFVGINDGKPTCATPGNAAQNNSTNTQ